MSPWMRWTWWSEWVAKLSVRFPVGFKGRVIEWNIPDPYGRELSFFRSVRDSIQRQVLALLNDLDQSAEDANRE